MELTTTAPRIGALGHTLGRILQADFTQVRPFAILAAAFILARVPFLDYGHGTDPDAWRVVLTAQHLLETGDYFPSRLPGNPLHELVITLFVPGGWIATNLATALFSLLGVYVFALILKYHRVEYAGLVTIGFAFMPLLFINSIATMDYMWTLTVLLGSYYMVLIRQPVFAGLLLGCAVGFRLQSVIVWLPLAYLLWRTAGLKQVVPFSLAAGGVAAIAFAPVLVVYGLEFVNYYDASVGYQDVLRLLGKEALGILGSLGVLAGAAVSLRRLARLPRDAIAEPAVLCWLAIIVVYFASFSRLPHEIAYLIPVFPFGLLLMARYFKPVALGGAIAAMLVAGIVDITTESNAIDLASVRTANVGRGLLLSNADTMRGQKAFVDEFVAAPVPDHSVVYAGFLFPQLAVRESDHLDARILQEDYQAISMLSDRGEAVDEERDVRYVWLLTHETFEALRSQGYSFFLVPDAAGSTYALYDYRPMLLGASYLELDRDQPTTGEGTAETDR